MLLVALARPERVHALVGLASATDFTEDLMWEVFDENISSAFASLLMRVLSENM